MRTPSSLLKAPSLKARGNPRAPAGNRTSGGPPGQSPQRSRCDGGYLIKGRRAATEGSRLLVRNFYGALRIADTLDSGIPVRQLSHGTIDHGEQIQDILRRRWPTTYYGPNSGVGLTIKKLQETGPIRYGVIGLGTGTLSTYARKGDYCRMYDINPW